MKMKEYLESRQRQVELFRQSAKDLKPLAGDDEEQVIKWAYDKGYISLTQFLGEYYYKEEDYEVAVMNAVKEGWNGDGKLTQRDSEESLA